MIAPLNLDTDERRTERGTNFLRLMARLKPGLPRNKRRLSLRRSPTGCASSFPMDNGNLTAPRVLKLQDEIVGEYRQMLGIIFGAVIARAHDCLPQSRESSARACIGAAARVGDSQCTRGKPLADFAATTQRRSHCWHWPAASIGLLLASWGKDAAVWLAPSDFPHARDITVDPLRSWILSRHFGLRRACRESCAGVS